MRFLLDNLALKAVSLGLAFVLWFIIAREKTSEKGVFVPVELQNFPADLELTGDPVNMVEVRLRASPKNLQQLGPGEISAQVDLQGAGEGERIVHLRPDSIHVPFGVRVVRINPSIITLNFDRTREKVVPIRPRLLGRPAAGYEVAEIVSDPPQTRIAGPKSRVQEVESAFTEPVSVEGVEANVVEEVNLGLEDPLLRIQGSPRVRVTARIREIAARRVLSDLALGVRGGTATTRPPKVKVILSGPVALLRQLGASDVRPFVNVANVPEESEVPVTVDLSGHPGVSVQQVEPARVTVRPVRKKGS